MRNHGFPILTIVVFCLLCQTSFAAHTVLSGVDLYPYGSQRSSNVCYYKGWAFVAAEGAYSPVTVVHSVDVSDPYNISRICSSGQAGKAYGLKAVDDKLYVAYWTTHLLRVFDISETGVLSLNWQIYGHPTYPAAWVPA